MLLGAGYEISRTSRKNEMKDTVLWLELKIAQVIIICQANVSKSKSM